MESLRTVLNIAFWVFLYLVAAVAGIIIWRLTTGNF